MRVGGYIHDPEIGLRIGANWLHDRAVEAKLAAVRAEDEISDVHRNGGQLIWTSTRRGDRVNICGWEFVIGLVDALGKEVDARIVVAPDEFALVKIAAGKLHRLSEFVGSGGHVQYPYVLVALGVEIALIVAAIDRSADDVDVGFVLALQFNLFRLRGVLGGFRFLGLAALRGSLLALRLLDVFQSRSAQKRYALTVRRPDGIRSTFRHIGEDPGFSACQREHCYLSRLGLAGFVLVTTADKGDALTIWRPPRPCVVLGIRHPYGRLAAGRDDRPD